MLLHFAAQGSGRVLPQVLAGTARMFIAAGGGWLAVARLGAGPATLFAIVALSSVLFGSISLVVARQGSKIPGARVPASPGRRLRVDAEPTFNAD